MLHWIIQMQQGFSSASSNEQLVIKSTSSVPSLQCFICGSTLGLSFTMQIYIIASNKQISVEVILHYKT